MKRIWLALWFLSQTLGFALPARPTVAGQDLPRRVAWEKNQAGHHGYDTGDQSCVIYAAELPSVATENLIDRASAVPKSVGYDSCLFSTIRSVGGPRAPPAENFGSLAAKTGLNPAEINFSQRTVSANVRQYADDMAAGNWDWSRSGPLRVMERDGQWVSYDNRRLMAAQQAGVGEVLIQVVQPGQLMPGSSLTWDQTFTRRFTDPRNVQAGGVVPNAGLSTQP